MLKALLMCLALTVAAPVIAQSWPTKPVKIVVPFPPGGSADPIARLLATKLQETLGQPFVVENKPGASGAIGTGLVAKSAPDGYSWVVVFDTHAVNPFLIPQMPFDSQKDLQPVMVVGVAPLALATHPAKPFKTLRDVVAAAKAKPGQITFGSVQNGSTGHLQMMLWQQAANVKMVHAPYRGAGPMVTDALGGHIDLAIGSAAVIAPQVRAGKLRGLVVTSAKRAGSMPEVPTLTEEGFASLDAYAWWGLYAPAGTPRPILERFHAEAVKVFNSPDVKQQLEGQLGMQIVAGTPEEMRAFVDAEMSKWGKIVREHGIKLE